MREVYAYCPRCEVDLVCDVPIHDGESIRRDCKRCGHFLGWPLWHGNAEIAERFQAQKERDLFDDESWHRSSVVDPANESPPENRPAEFTESADAMPCKKCGCKFRWIDGSGQRICFECIPPPSASMISAIAYADESNGKPGWLDVSAACIPIVESRAKSELATRLRRNAARKSRDKSTAWK